VGDGGAQAWPFAGLLPGIGKAEIQSARDG
jgi:hypothetical protein